MQRALRVIKRDFYKEADLRSAVRSFGSKADLVKLHVLEIET